jgi:PIN domain nuclease of toxin-antitoxin system
VGIAAITLWEIAMLVEKKRIALDRDVLAWLQETIRTTRVTVLPLTAQIAVAATAFRELRDPSDRLIAATALTHGVPLVTKDERNSAKWRRRHDLVITPRPTASRTSLACRR